VLIVIKFTSGLSQISSNFFAIDALKAAYAGFKPYKNLTTTTTDSMQSIIPSNQSIYRSLVLFAQYHDINYIKSISSVQCCQVIRINCSQLILSTLLLNFIDDSFIDLIQSISSKLILCYNLLSPQLAFPLSVTHWLVILPEQSLDRLPLH
jgi:hypothetical protein